MVRGEPRLFTKLADRRDFFVLVVRFAGDSATACS
jgi:hypothetical protein